MLQNFLKIFQRFMNRQYLALTYHIPLDKQPNSALVASGLCSQFNLFLAPPSSAWMMTISRFLCGLYLRPFLEELLKKAFLREVNVTLNKEAGCKKKMVWKLCKIISVYMTNDNYNISRDCDYDKE